MGLNFRKRSGRIANGSTLIVPGQPYIGAKVFQLTFNQKKSSNDKPMGPEIQFEVPPTPTPTSSTTPTPTPTPTSSTTPTPTPTPTVTVSPTPTPTVTVSPTPEPTKFPELPDVILVDQNTYLEVGKDEYLKYN